MFDALPSMHDGGGDEEEEETVLEDDRYIRTTMSMGDYMEDAGDRPALAEVTMRALDDYMNKEEGMVDLLRRQEGGEDVGDGMWDAGEDRSGNMFLEGLDQGG